MPHIAARPDKEPMNPSRDDDLPWKIDLPESVVTKAIVFVNPPYLAKDFDESANLALFVDEGIHSTTDCARSRVFKVSRSDGIPHNTEVPVLCRQVELILLGMPHRGEADESSNVA